jgi:hypothetical protein
MLLDQLSGTGIQSLSSRKKGYVSIRQPTGKSAPVGRVDPPVFGDLGAFLKD